MHRPLKGKSDLYIVYRFYTLVYSFYSMHPQKGKSDLYQLTFLCASNRSNTRRYSCQRSVAALSAICPGRYAS
eukprot:9303885-Pyramimonas_sp.AAC.1